jgi:phosphatidyl-myo-inositol dimannoside synthase
VKVLVLAPPMEQVGGVQSFTTAFTRALRAILGETSVRLLAVQPSIRICETQGSLCAIGERQGLTAAVKARFLLRALWEQAHWQATLCICTHVGLAATGKLIRTFSRCPYWVVAHGVEVWGRLPGGKGRALRQADTILAVSAFTRQRLIERHLVSPGRAVVFPNALDTALQTESRASDPLSPLGVHAHKLILTVGRLAASERYKGQDVILQALPEVLARVPEAMYLIVGDGEDRTRLEGMARELGVEDHVVFLGTLVQGQLAACYRACHVFALPARTVMDDRVPKGEGFGIAFLEAMAFGKPVLGPNYGAPTEFIRQNENGLLVDPESPHDVASALVKLLTQPEVAREMGECGRRLVEQDYSLGAMVRRLEPILAAVR